MASLTSSNSLGPNLQTSLNGPSCSTRTEAQANFECPICYENVTDPRLTGICGHTVCGPCGRDLLAKVRQNRGNKVLSCPECRITQPLHMIGPELPKNVGLTREMEYQMERERLESQSKRLCEICVRSRDIEQMWIGFTNRSNHKEREEFCANCYAMSRSEGGGRTEKYFKIKLFTEMESYRDTLTKMQESEIKKTMDDAWNQCKQSVLHPARLKLCETYLSYVWTAYNAYIREEISPLVEAGDFREASTIIAHVKSKLSHSIDVMSEELKAFWSPRPFLFDCFPSIAAFQLKNRTFKVRTNVNDNINTDAKEAKYFGSVYIVLRPHNHPEWLAEQKKLDSYVRQGYRIISGAKGTRGEKAYFRKTDADGNTYSAVYSYDEIQDEDSLMVAGEKGLLIRWSSSKSGPTVNQIEMLAVPIQSDENENSPSRESEQVASCSSIYTPGVPDDIPPPSASHTDNPVVTCTSKRAAIRVDSRIDSIKEDSDFDEAELWPKRVRLSENFEPTYEPISPPGGDGKEEYDSDSDCIIIHPIKPPMTPLLPPPSI